ncbi:MAG: immunoglobulin domain-containing protein [Opitutales bacterium]|jgi:hypothetical protein|nr:immunoglobulin domain-containing protein [Opitutales bacterium]MDP4644429.1 immunoglobulin domain-containing protein [Opitutales bacterium]MDP4777317.1 immunoglobulin domain-containing protein [Opitutales bacterium]MDP4883540.1 immunoglobulin domain-containing protein [Opitutales bacterium]
MNIPASRILFAFLALLSPTLWGTTYNITNAAGFSSLPSTLNGGDIVTIQNGTYNNINKTITANGTALNPVQIYAVNPGNVYFSGEIRFTLKGSGMVISGLAFDGDVVAGQPQYPSGLFRFDTDSSDITLRDCLIRNFDVPVTLPFDPETAPISYFIQLNGYRHTIEYCSFIGKAAKDPILNIIPTEGIETKDIPRRHVIRHCYFADRVNIGDNGYEAIRIGESQFQMYDMSTVVEYCLFDKAIYGPNISNYEPEVISSKSRNNIYRYNTFRENKGGLVLRHGDDNVIDGNFFFGIPKPGVPVTPPEGEIEIERMGAGIRVIGLRHVIRNNYFEGIHGTELRAAICLMKGSGEFSDGSTSNGYESPGTARFFHNTIIDCEQPFALGATTSSSGTNAPQNVEIRNNAVQSIAGNGDVIDFNSANGWSISQIAFSDNQAYHADGTYGTVPASGFTTGTPVNLALDVGLGYHIPQAGSPLINAAAATTPATYFDVRSKLRSGASNDVGNYDTEATGTSYGKPLVKADVGPDYDGRTNANRVPTINEHPISATVFEGDTLVLSVAAESPQSLSYQWYLDEVAISGATGTTLDLTPVATADAGAYSVAVTNATGRALSFASILEVDPAAPVITSQPTSTLVGIGDDVTFTVAVNGIAPFTYQWRKDGTPIPMTDSDTLELTNVQASDEADYSVYITNAYGNVTSDNATLSISVDTLIVNDDFSDLDRTKTGSLDADWWSSNSTSGNSVEIDGTGLGLISGTSGRGIHATFTPQTLVIGQKLTVTYIFTTPATIGTNKGGSFKVALMDFNNAGLAADLLSSSSSVNSLYTNLPGYMTDFDVTTGTEDISIYKHDTPNTLGRFLGTANEWTSIGDSSDDGYTLTASTAYVGVLSVSRTGADTMEIFSSLSVSGGALLESHTVNDSSGIANNFGMLGFWANSSTYGSTTSSNPDNGITFTNVTVALGAITAPEPPLETWRSTYFGMTEGTGNAANDFDYDFDGLPNLIEYLLGLDPTVYDSEGAVSAEVSDVGGTDYLTLTFDRDLAATGVSLSVRATSDLALVRSSWDSIDPDGANQVNSDTVGNIETLTVRDNLPTTGANSRFMLIEVTEP